jgi:hypothetical protein
VSIQATAAERALKVKIIQELVARRVRRGEPWAADYKAATLYWQSGDRISSAKRGSEPRTVGFVRDGVLRLAPYLPIAAIAAGKTFGFDQVDLAGLVVVPVEKFRKTNRREAVNGTTR